MVLKRDFPNITKSIIDVQQFILSELDIDIKLIVKVEDVPLISPSENLKLPEIVPTRKYLENFYSNEDMILCQTNSQKDKYTSMFPNFNKFYVKSNSNSMFSNGDIFTDIQLTTKLIPGSYEKRHGFTVHSVQGESVRTKLFIDMSGMDPKMIYTAISRCVDIDNVYILA